MVARRSTIFIFTCRRVVVTYHERAVLGRGQAGRGAIWRDGGDGHDTGTARGQSRPQLMTEGYINIFGHAPLLSSWSLGIRMGIT